MNRADRLLLDLVDALATATVLVARGRDDFDRDVAVPLAFESLCNRVGDLAKQLAIVDSARFSHPIFAQAARNRDFIVHHYHRIDRDALWVTVSRDFPALSALVSELGE